MSLPSFFDAVSASIQARSSGARDAAIRTAAEAFRPVLVADALGAAVGAPGLRLLTNLVARTYGSLGLLVPDPLGAELAGLARSINPRIEVSLARRSVSVVFGESRPDGPAIWCGGDGWTVRLAISGPVAQAPNPLSSAVGAALIAGELSRRAFEALLPPEWEPMMDVSLSLLTYRVGDNTIAEWPAQTPVGTLHLVGAGAIGSAIAYGLNLARGVRGLIHVIDNQTIEISNLQRYITAFPADVQVHRKKTAILAGTLARPGLRVKEHDRTWESFLANEPDRWRFERVITALDTAAARRNVQAALPREILNGGVGLSQLNVGRYTFDGAHECLACAYLHVPPPNIFSLMVQVFGLSFERVQELHTANRPLEDADVAIIEARTNRRGELRHLRGLTPSSAYARMCGYATPADAVANEGGLVPLAHAPVLSGLLIAVELVKSGSEQLSGFALPHVLEADLRFALEPASRLLQEQWRDQTTLCICSDPDYRTVYAGRWTTTLG